MILGLINFYLGLFLTIVGFGRLLFLRDQRKPYRVAYRAIWDRIATTDTFVGLSLLDNDIEDYLKVFQGKEAKAGELAQMLANYRHAKLAGFLTAKDREVFTK